MEACDRSSDTVWCFPAWESILKEPVKSPWGWTQFAAPSSDSGRRRSCDHLCRGCRWDGGRGRLLHLQRREETLGRRFLRLGTTSGAVEEELPTGGPAVSLKRDPARISFVCYSWLFRKCILNEHLINQLLKNTSEFSVLHGRKHNSQMEKGQRPAWVDNLKDWLLNLHPVAVTLDLFI